MRKDVVIHAQRERMLWRRRGIRAHSSQANRLTQDDATVERGGCGSLTSGSADDPPVISHNAVSSQAADWTHSEPTASRAESIVEYPGASESGEHRFRGTRTEVMRVMLGYKSDSWFYPKPTGDPGRDRNARTVQFSALLLASAITLIATLSLIAREPKEIPFLAFSVAGLVGAMVTNRAGKGGWAACLPFSAVLLTAMLLVFEARDGFRSNAMLLFPGILLLSVMLLDRVAYTITAGVILLAVPALGIAERQGLTHAIRGFRSSTTYESIFVVDLFLLIFAMIGSRVSHDTRSNVFDLRTAVDRLSRANLELKQTAEARRTSEQQLDSVYNAVVDPIFHLAVEPESRFRFLSVNASFLRVTGLSREMVVGKIVNEVIPEPSLTMVVCKYRQAIQQKTAILWEETSDYPTGRLTGVVSVVPIFDDAGNCSHLVGSVHDITERKRAEAALQESEERFRTLADTAPVMIWVSGPDKLCTFFNKPWLDFTGRSLDEELGNGWASGVHSQDLDRCLATYTSSFDARRPFQMEYRLRRADGVYRWLLDKGIPRYRRSDFVGFVGSCIDITERKLAEERLQAREIQFKDAQRLAQVGSWERHIEADTIQWSDEMLRIFGLQECAPPSFNEFLSLVHPKDRQRTVDAHAKVRSIPGPVDVEYRVVTPEGDIRFVRSILEAVANDQGLPVRIVGATQDVTEQVGAQELLRQSEERLRNAERLANVGNWRWDLDTDELIWSEGMLRIFGEPSHYAPSYDGFLQAVISQDRERLRRVIRDAVADHDRFSDEVQIARPDGDLRTISFVGEPLIDEEGSLKAMFGATQDITDLRRAQMQDFARQKLESLGTLAAGIGHDFNNLLGAVLVQAEVGLMNLAGGSNPEGELKTIRDVAVRGADVVRQLMTYAGKESAVVGLVDVSQTIREMLALLKVSVSKHALLEVRLGQDLPFVRANAAELQQVVMNLVTNASDAIGHRDGVIRITTKCLLVDQDSWALSHGLDEGDYLQLEVSDTGCGMPPEIQAKLFDPFFTTKSAGHGLGLSIIHGIVRGLHGAIQVMSDPGRGTTFQVLLPRAEAMAEEIGEATADTAELAGQLLRATVLVVEDEDPLRQAVVKMLRRTGLEVFEAADGSTAINLLHDNAGNIDLILLDMTIPGPSSTEVMAEAGRTGPHIGVILTSAYSREMLADALSEPQVRGFIRKPFQLEALVRTIRNTLRKR